MNLQEDRWRRQINPTPVTVEIKKSNGTQITPLTQADTEVTIGATLGDDLARELGLTAAENTAKTGIVQVLPRSTSAAATGSSTAKAPARSPSPNESPAKSEPNSTDPPVRRGVVQRPSTLDSRSGGPGSIRGPLCCRHLPRRLHGPRSPPGGGFSSFRRLLCGG